MAAPVPGPVPISLATETGAARRRAANHLARGLWLLATRLVLVRLVTPEAHGVYDVAFQVVVLVSVLRDLGLSAALPGFRDEPPWATVLAWSAGIGALAATTLAVSAHWASALLPVFDGPAHAGVPEVLRVLAAWVFLDALTTTPRAYLDRHGGGWARAVPEALRAVAFTVVAVWLARRGLGVWSLVAAELVSAGLLAVGLWGTVGRRIPWRFEGHRLGQLLDAAFAVLALPVALQLLARVDVFLVGWFTDAETVGHYGRAYLLAFLLPMLLAPRLLGPTLLRHRDDPEALLATLRVGSALLLVPTVAAGYLLFVNAEILVALLLGEGWEPVIPILRVLAFVPLLDALTRTGAEVLKVRRLDGWWLAVVAVDLVALTAAAILWGRGHGAVGVAAAQLVVPGRLLLMGLLWRDLGPGVLRVVGELALIALAPLPLFAAAVVLTEEGSGERLAASLVAAGVAFMVLWLRYGGRYRERVAAGR